MEPIAILEDPLEDDTLESSTSEWVVVHAWRVEQLMRLGVPHVLAAAFADSVDWHALAELVACGCSPQLALEIVR
jgi:hypothetical protein